MRTIPVLGTMPAIFGMAAASYILCQLAGQPFTSEPLFQLQVWLSFCFCCYYNNGCAAMLEAVVLWRCHCSSLHLQEPARLQLCKPITCQHLQQISFLSPSPRGHHAG